MHSVLPEPLHTHTHTHTHTTRQTILLLCSLLYWQWAAISPPSIILITSGWVEVMSFGVLSLPHDLASSLSAAPPTSTPFWACYVAMIFWLTLLAAGFTRAVTQGHRAILACGMHLDLWRRAALIEWCVYCGWQCASVLTKYLNYLCNCVSD